LGHAPDEIEPGELKRFSTNGKRGDKAGWAYMSADGRGGAWGCHRTGITETWQAERHRPPTPAQRAELARQVAQAAAEREREQRQRRVGNARRNAALWAQCVPVTDGDPVALYLARRSLAGPVPECLRLHPGLTYWNGADGGELGTWPAMVAPLVAPDGRMVALHRTYLTPDGCKAPVPTVKKVTGASGPVAGASIPLFKPARGCIGIAEGIETALASWCASSVPTVAAYCAGNLAAYQWPPGVQRIVVFADADRAGRETADTLRARALRAGLRINVLTPTEPGSDWCDVWAQRGAVAVEGGVA